MAESESTNLARDTYSRSRALKIPAPDSKKKRVRYRGVPPLPTFDVYTLPLRARLTREEAAAVLRPSTACLENWQRIPRMHCSGNSSEAVFFTPSPLSAPSLASLRRKRRSLRLPTSLPIVRATQPLHRPRAGKRNRKSSTCRRKGNAGHARGGDRAEAL
jgi:hypothetical protein